MRTVIHGSRKGSRSSWCIALRAMHWGLSLKLGPGYIMIEVFYTLASWFADGFLVDDIDLYEDKQAPRSEHTPPLVQFDDLDFCLSKDDGEDEGLHRWYWSVGRTVCGRHRWHSIDWARSRPLALLVRLQKKHYMPDVVVQLLLAIFHNCHTPFHLNYTNWCVNHTRYVACEKCYTA